MFTIERSGQLERLLAADVLSRSDFAQLAQDLGQKPKRARKTGLVAARIATVVERIETRWNGKESTNTAEPGDHVVTSLAPNRTVLRDSEGHANTYVIKPATFARLYERIPEENEFGAIHRSSNVVKALLVTGGFDIQTPWGERQIATAGYILRNGDDVYGNHRQTFEATYEVVD